MKKNKTEFRLEDLGMELVVKTKPMITVEVINHNKGARAGIVLDKYEAHEIAKVLNQA